MPFESLSLSSSSTQILFPSMDIPEQRLYCGLNVSLFAHATINLGNFTSEIWYRGYFSRYAMEIPVLSIYWNEDYRVLEKCILFFFFFWYTYTRGIILHQLTYFDPYNFWKYVRSFIRNENMKTNIKTFPIKKHYLINSSDEKETNIATNERKGN